MQLQFMLKYMKFFWIFVAHFMQIIRKYKSLNCWIFSKTCVAIWKNLVNCFDILYSRPIINFQMINTAYYSQKQRSYLI